MMKTRQGVKVGVVGLIIYLFMFVIYGCEGITLMENKGSRPLAPAQGGAEGSGSETIHYQPFKK